MSLRFVHRALSIKYISVHTFLRNKKSLNRNKNGSGRTLSVGADVDFFQLVIRVPVPDLLPNKTGNSSFRNYNKKIRIKK